MCPNDEKQESPPTSIPATTADDSARRKLKSHELFGNAKELLIEHEGCCYYLRLTRQNKLILTK